MIDSLRIENFRGLTVSLEDMKPVTIIGGNRKTTLLDAISFRRYSSSNTFTESPVICKKFCGLNGFRKSHRAELQSIVKKYLPGHSLYESSNRVGIKTDDWQECLENAGSSMYYLINILATITVGDICLIDDIEAYLDHRKYDIVAKAMAESGKQIIATSKSYDFIMTAAEEAKENISFFRLDKSGTVRYGYENLESAAKFNMEIL